MHANSFHSTYQAVKKSGGIPVFLDVDPERHGNGPGDAGAPVSAHTLLSAASGGLGWSPPPNEQVPSDEVGCETLT